MLLWKKKRHFWYVFDKDNPWCSSSEAASCNSISIFCFNLRLQQRRGPDWHYYIDTVEGEGHQRGGVIISLLTQQKHKRLLLWIKHDPSAPSLLFHRQLSKYGDARCQHAFAFFFFPPFSSPVLIISVSASGELFWEMAKPKTNSLSHCCCWLIQLFNHVANGHHLHKWNLQLWMINCKKKKKSLVEPLSLRGFLAVAVSPTEPYGYCWDKPAGNSKNINKKTRCCFYRT